MEKLKELKEYHVEFGLYRKDGGEISIKTRERLIDAWTEAVEKENLLTGGGISERRRIDKITDMVWNFLWRWLPCLRPAV